MVAIWLGSNSSGSSEVLTCRVGRQVKQQATRTTITALSYGYDAMDRLTFAAYDELAPAGAQSYAYTRTGAATQDNVYNGVDDRVRVTATTGVVADVRRFVYDADGRLMGEHGASAGAADVKGEFVWLSPEAANDNAWGGDDGTGGHTFLAVTSGAVATPVVQRLHTNYLGSPVVTTDATGTPVAPGSYAAIGYPGQIGTLVDLYYNRYRDHNPSTGRYIQADPIGLKGSCNQRRELRTPASAGIARQQFYYGLVGCAWTL